MSIKHHARALRKEMTPAERLLWRHLRGCSMGAKFRRQMPIGRYIPDFVCPEFGLVIELDGGQHCENTDDQRRDAWLEAQGFKVLRFWNPEVVTQLEATLEVIRLELEARPRRFRPHRLPAPPP